MWNVLSVCAAWEEIPGPFQLPALKPAVSAARIVASGESLSVYSAVFAPIQLRTNIVHNWQRYDENAGWQTQSIVRFPITGGRDGGYRGYSTKSMPQRGRWRARKGALTDEGALVGSPGESATPVRTDLPGGFTGRAVSPAYIQSMRLPRFLFSAAGVLLLAAPVAAQKPTPMELTS